ncbi:MAG: hypothetical protein OXC27_03665 [Caldilineaceae bacterium]|nr:hypothetical protein [Caldilineaceae bacterium]
MHRTAFSKAARFTAQKKRRAQWPNASDDLSKMLQQGKSGLRKRADAGGAQATGNQPVILKHFDLLNVDLPLMPCGLSGPGTIVSKLRTLTALLAFRHDLFPPVRRWLKVSETPLTPNQ